MVNHYELLYILGAKMAEEEVLPIIDGITNLIKEIGGEIKREENWGKRKLAYSIDRFQYGYYFLSVIDMEPEMVPKLNDQLRLSHDIIRYQIVKVKSVDRPQKLRPEPEKSAKITYFGDDEMETPGRQFHRSASAPVSAPQKQTVPTTETPSADKSQTDAVETTPTESAKKPAKKAKISIEELDQKIDEILKV